MEKTPVVMERGSEAIAQETAAIEKYNNLLAAGLSKSQSFNTDAKAKLI
jgi:hypothetical protein